MNEPSVLIPISEYEKLKKAYDERNKPLEYPYGKVINLPDFNHITGYHYDMQTKYYQCKEDILNDFEKEYKKLSNVIEKLQSELQVMQEKIEHAPTFLGYKYFKE
jgi:glutaredoxin 2